MKHRKSRLVTTLGAVAASTLLLAACSSGGDVKKDEEATPESGAAAEKATDGPYDVAFIQGVIGDNFYISMECGAKDAAAELGNVNLSVQGPQKWDPALQQPIVASVQASKPGAILIAPNDVTALQRPLEEAAKDSKIVLVDTTVEDPSFAVSEISSDNVGGGEAAFDAIRELVPEGGKVLVIDNQPGISTSDDRVAGFEAAVEAYEDYEYLGVQYAQNQPAKAASIVTATLQAHPDLKAIFATNIFSAEGAATGIEQAQATGEVQIVGFDAGPAQVQALEDGTVQAIIAQQPYQIGYQAVFDAVHAIMGEPVEAKTQTGFTIVTKESLETEEGQAALYASDCG